MLAAAFKEAHHLCNFIEIRAALQWSVYSADAQHTVSKALEPAENYAYGGLCWLSSAPAEERAPRAARKAKSRSDARVPCMKTSASAAANGSF